LAAEARVSDAADEATGGVQRRNGGRLYNRVDVEAEPHVRHHVAARWAGANGVTVPSGGRIPQAVVDQYKRAGGR